MSAKSYQLRLRETVERLAVATRSAQEWRKVADNRLLLLYTLDDELNRQIVLLGKVGTIFGVDPSPPGLPGARESMMSGDETTGVVMEKLLATASFVSNLTREAFSLQLTLDETLAIAVGSLHVEPPTSDLNISQGTKARSVAESPIHQVYVEIEDMPDASPPAEESDMEDAPDVSEQNSLVVRGQGRGLFSL